ncbi:unnamed protein product [Caenorhabditis auriculariae]|uniref:3-hydroxy-3-methylglutaryl coenzyme A reductase n=1 Tax=Caenorhabditis auriculariae TaxID=2777116 RepID=A0A8S1HBH3_9PELO|nr:unnamed protein product [Caenorhabditis auriculariae]
MLRVCKEPASTNKNDLVAFFSLSILFVLTGNALLWGSPPFERFLGIEESRAADAVQATPPFTRRVTRWARPFLPAASALYALVESSPAAAAVSPHIITMTKVRASIELRKYLENADLTEDDWIGALEYWLVDVWVRYYLREPRTPKFSVGDEEEATDSSSTSSVITEITEVVEEKEESKEIRPEVGIQCNLDAEFAEAQQLAKKQELAPGARTLDDVEGDWRTGRRITAGESMRLLKQGIMKLRDLEGAFGNDEAISIRRTFYNLGSGIPFKDYDYKYVVESCCENVVGYIPVPVGVVGPLLVNHVPVFVPMATTEGALVASTMRGCKAIEMAGGVKSYVYDNGMTRAPVVSFPCAGEAVCLKRWMDIPENYGVVKREFESTSRFAQLKRVEVIVDGCLVFLRFVAFTGDAMGMNMVSKGCSASMRFLAEEFPRMKMLSLSGNYCVDKKPAAINWINGRGQSVVAECVFSDAIVKKIFKTSPKEIADASTVKLQIGSSRAGCLGGSNAHSANIVSAIFIATGQDAAQVVSSSMCSTQMNVTEEGQLYVSVTMPCLEIGTVGGGTILPPQKTCLKLMDCAGPATVPGEHTKKLAEIIAGTVLAGEISLMAALVNDDLVSSHMKLNRSKLDLYPAEEEKTRTKQRMLLEKLANDIPQRDPSEPKQKRIERVECSNIL